MSDRKDEEVNAVTEGRVSGSGLQLLMARKAFSSDDAGAYVVIITVIGREFLESEMTFR
jgi:hypothetical protein